MVAYKPSNDGTHKLILLTAVGTNISTSVKRLKQTYILAINGYPAI
ncbi:hypothetical protein [Perlabentimonas gracilis]|nr:hypothetical protein [Perlabentimonas gracilis]